ncbi:MAG: gamma-glutamylcyclotransferase [Gemmataceae bacterium]
MATALLFVYGTLKTGYPNNHFLQDQRFLGPARTAPLYRLFVNDWYPCLVPDTCQGQRIAGEVWQVDEETLRRLDDYEGVPTWFTRQPVRLEGHAELIWAYFYQGEVTTLRECANGVWPPE